MADLWDNTPRPAIERLARIEGQSNFLSLLAGIEAGPDTTEDMAALAFSRRKGAVPEVLEAHVAQSALFKLPLMSMVFEAVKRELKPEAKDYPWVQGAIADAFLLIQRGECKPVEVRARRFRVDKAAYGAMRKLASSVYAEMVARAETQFHRARIRETPASRHTENEGDGNFRAPRAPDADDPEIMEFRGIAPGVTERLGWDERNAVPGPCITLPAQPPAPG